MTGEIPAELGSLAGLKSYSLWENGLTGCIPGGLRDRAAKTTWPKLGLDYCMPAASDAATDRALQRHGRSESLNNGLGRPRME